MERGRFCVGQEVRKQDNEKDREEIKQGRQVKGKKKNKNEGGEGCCLSRGDLELSDLLTAAEAVPHHRRPSPGTSACSQRLAMIPD